MTTLDDERIRELRREVMRALAALEARRETLLQMVRAYETWLSLNAPASTNTEAQEP